MLFEHQGVSPRVHESAYVAPTAVVCGDVTIGPNSRVLFGAVLVAEGGPLELGTNCIVMEQAVLRGTARYPLRLGDHVLVGPHAHLTGCSVEDCAFIATGDLARILPPDQHELIWAIQEPLDFPGTVFGIQRAPPGKTILPDLTRRYARALGKHARDRVLDA